MMYDSSGPFEVSSYVWLYTRLSWFLIFPPKIEYNNDSDDWLKAVQTGIIAGYPLALKPTNHNFPTLDLNQHFMHINKVCLSVENLILRKHQVC